MTYEPPMFLLQQMRPSLRSLFMKRLTRERRLRNDCDDAIFLRRCRRDAFRIGQRTYRPAAQALIAFLRRSLMKLECK
jgi:hypothetical protein